MDKKAMANIGGVIWGQWPELFSLLVLVFGLIMAISIQNAYLSYAVIFLAGLMAGRLIYTKKGKKPLFPFFLIALGFLVGFALGSVKFNWKLIIFLFALGAGLSYYIHKQGYVR